MLFRCTETVKGQSTEEEGFASAGFAEVSASGAIEISEWSGCDVP